MSLLCMGIPIRHNKGETMDNACLFILINLNAKVSYSSNISDRYIQKTNKGILLDWVYKLMKFYIIVPSPL